MIYSEKCNCCIHDKICSFKNEYISACEAIKNCSYGTGYVSGQGQGFMYLRDSNVSVSIKCPHMMTRGD